MLEANKAVVQRFIEDVFNAGNTDAIADFCIPGSMLAGGLEGQVKMMKTQFPDFSMTVEELLAEGDKVVARLTLRGTNTGPMLGMPVFGQLETPVPPTGNSVMATLIYIFSVSDGKIRSIVYEFDQIGVLQQLGWTFTPPGLA